MSETTQNSNAPSIKTKFGNKDVALYLVGGGIESASSAGMLGAIESTQWERDFSMIIGASAGSMMAGYLLTGRAIQGASGYWKVFPQFAKEKKYFNLLGPLQGRPFLDMETVIRELLSQRNPLCWQSTIDHPINQAGKLYIQLFCAKSGNVFYMHRFQTVRALKAAVTGSCWIPFLAGLKPYRLSREILSEASLIDEDGKKREVEGLDVFDGYIVDPYFERARQLFESSKNLILDPFHPDRYHTMDAQFGQNLKWLERYTAMFFFREYPKAVSQYIKVMLDGGIISQARRTLELHREKDEKIHMIHPDRAVEIQGHRESREEVLRQKVISGWNGYFNSLDMETPALPQLWAA